MFVRITWSSNLTPGAREALEGMADGLQAAVSGNANARTKEGVNVNRQTAMIFLRFGYAEACEDAKLAITREGEIKVGRIELSRAERQRRKAAESLKAQESGEWAPVPAGYSAAAERDQRDSKRFWALAVEGVHAAKAHLNGERRMMKMAKTWGYTDEELEVFVEELEKAKARLASAEAHLRSLKGEGKRAA